MLWDGDLLGRVLLNRGHEVVEGYGLALVYVCLPWLQDNKRTNFTRGINALLVLELSRSIRIIPKLGAVFPMIIGIFVPRVNHTFIRRETK